MKTIEAVETTSGSRERVWSLLEHAPTWAEWGPWSSVEVDGGGEQGPGAERILVSRPFRVRERITEWEPRERLGYELLEGMRVRGYRSTSPSRTRRGEARPFAGARSTSGRGP